MIGTKKIFSFLILFQTSIAGGLYAQPGSGAITNYNNAQQTMNDAFGRPLYMHTEYRVEGNPFFPEEYCIANIRISKGKKYEGFKVKLNLLENLVLYKISDTAEMVVILPVDRIEFVSGPVNVAGTVFQSGFPAIDLQTKESFYQVLDSGIIQLLKFYKINTRDKTEYGNATPVRYFEKAELFYVYTADKKMLKIARNNEAVLNMLADKKQLIENYINANNLKCRKEEDMVKVFTYYNSLK